MKIEIVLTDGFALRNIETSGLLDSLKVNGHDVSVKMFKQTTKSNLLCRFSTRLKYNIYLGLKLRYAYIKRFKKHAFKLEHQKDVDLPKAEKVAFSILSIFFIDVHGCTIFFKKLPPGVVLQSPDIVLITNVQDHQAQSIIKYCEQKDIAVIGIVNSWDHLTHGAEVIQSKVLKKYLVWNRIHVEELKQFHNIEMDKVEIVGPLQFDVLNKNKKNQQSQRKGLERWLTVIEGKKIFFLPAYNERHGKYEPMVMGEILKQASCLQDDFILVIRPYPNDQTFKQRFVNLLKHPQVLIMENKQSVEEDREIMSSFLQYSDIVFSGCGTAAIEAMYYDTPVIHLGIEPDENQDMNSLFKKNFYSDHYQHIMHANPSHFVETFDGLIKAINIYLENPSVKSNERKTVIAEHVHYMDGNAHGRIVQCIESIR